MSSSDELEAEPTDHAVIQRLEASLQAIGIQVAEGAVQQLLDKKEWIYPSKRVADLRKKLTEDQLYSVFNDQHHLQSATLLFDFLKNQDSCVVYGHKAQGKTQFLFFVFKLLQATGEKVLFLDRTILPLEDDKMVDLTNDRFCGYLWKDSFDMETVQPYLDQFYKDSLPDSFGKFTKALRQYSRSSKTRIWIIVDEVVLFDDFPISLPTEQDLGPFNWIITGSAGIGSWVAKRHLENLVFDLPLFDKTECLNFATHLSSMLNINLEDTIGVPAAGIDDWLEERFAGVIGYIAELILEISKGKTVSQYMTILDDRMNKLIQETATKKSISNKQLAEDWLNEIKYRNNNWLSLRNAGLCGSYAPRGVIFALILKLLYTFYPGEDALSLVTFFRSKFTGDPGLDGCLLELEEILKLKARRSIEASLLTLNDQEWNIDKPMHLPPSGMPLNALFYSEDHLMLEEFPNSSSSSWYLIHVPSGFPVIDVVLVNTKTGSSAIYGIQITRSLNPFASHCTYDTCSRSSKEKLEKLWRVISGHFKLDDMVKKFYVMLAPKCEGGQFKPPVGHSSEIYFSPMSVITAYDPSKPKRPAHNRVSTRSSSAKKKSS